MDSKVLHSSKLRGTTRVMGSGLYHKRQAEMGQASRPLSGQGWRTQVLRVCHHLLPLILLAFSGLGGVSGRGPAGFRSGICTT